MKADGQFFQFQCATLGATLEIMKIYLEGAQRIRAHQLKMINEALIDYAESAKQVQSAKSDEELLAIQERMARAQTEKLIRYWNGLYQAAAQTQGEILNRATISGTGEGLRHSLRTAAGAHQHYMDALRSMADAAVSAFLPAGHPFEQAAREAEGEVASAHAGIQHGDASRKRKAA